MIVPLQPAVEGTRTAAFEREEQSPGHHLTRIQVRLGMFGERHQDVINMTEQRDDNPWGAPLVWCPSTISIA